MEARILLSGGVGLAGPDRSRTHSPCDSVFPEELVSTEAMKDGGNTTALSSA